MTTSRYFLGLVLLLAGCQAQNHAGHSPYAGQENQTLKALSDEEVQGYLEGAGLGFAKVAELNGYPGPLHVLELADPLGLTPEQRTQTQALFDAMNAEARALGQQVIDGETQLEQAFAAETVTNEALAPLVAQVAAYRGQLRLAHLRAHLQMKALLTQHQQGQYQQLRGYTADGAHLHDPSHQHR